MCEVSKPVTCSFSRIMASVLEIDEQCKRLSKFFEVYAILNYLQVKGLLCSKY